jgi:hypothetical protein
MELLHMPEQQPTVLPDAADIPATAPRDAYASRSSPATHVADDGGLAAAAAPGADSRMPACFLAMSGV